MHDDEADPEYEYVPLDLRSPPGWAEAFWDDVRRTVRRGAMCRKSTGNGTQFTDASGAGAPAVCGRAGWGEITCSQPIR